MSRMQRQPADEPGQDAFLDVVANLVGIFIILVMVIGVRAKDALLEAAPASAADAATDRVAELQYAKQAADGLESDVHRLMATLDRQEIEVDYRREERNRAQLLIAATKDAIAQRREQLDASQQAQFDVQRDLIAVRAGLEDLQMGRKALEHAVNTPTIIQHLPTPMAKTVFGKELHFRLSRSRLTFIPWDELIKELEREAQQQVRRLKNEPAITETLGPIGGFWMKYTLKRTETAIPTKVGMSVRQRVELDHFVVIPTSQQQGEAVDEALKDGSQFGNILSQHEPQNTTVTVWTYPDSFGEYRVLKQRLFQMGYLTACRPLPEGQHISGSPQGTRSASE
ncbi:MAG: hypothetical protein ACC628_10290 [Pirellulaceae bacterium]